MGAHLNTHIRSGNKNDRNNSFVSRLQEIFWWEPSQESLPAAFCQDTSLHGLKYVGQPKRHLIERLFWLGTFITGVIVAFILINGVWDKYNNSPVIVSFQEKETKIEQLPFPAITICNVNNVLKSKAQSYITIAQQEENVSSEVSQKALKNVFFLNHICSSMALSFSQKFGYNANGSTVPQNLLDKIETFDQIGDHDSNGKQQTDIKDFLQNNAQSCTDMIHLCLWQDEIENCDDLFQPIETDFGKCCTFNMVPQSLLHTFTNDSRDNVSVLEEWGKVNLNNDALLLKTLGTNNNKFPRRTKKSGSTYGLSFLLNPDLKEYFCATADGTGFQLVTHLPTQVPHVVDYGIAIEFNKEIYITVSPEITTSDEIVKEISLKKRRCYFDGEFNLKYYAFYTESNCKEECVANLTFQTCQCVRYYMPTDNERKLCVPSKLNCTEGIKKSLARDSLAGGCKECLPTCTEINYVTTTSTSPIRDDVEIWIQEDGSIPEWSENNVSIVHVYFGKGSTYSKIRKELYGITDLIANTGGLLGLCLGFSALSALEVIYFLSLRAWYVFRSKKRFMTSTSNIKNSQDKNNVVNIIENEIETFPIQIQVKTNSNPYSQFIVSELYNTYYNSKQKNLNQ